MTQRPGASGLAADGQLLLSDWRYRAVIYSVVIAALGYLAFSLWGGWQDVVSAASRVGLAGIGVALGLSLVNYFLRFVRWQRYLAAMGESVPWKPSLRIYIAGFALTTTPGKAGETLRGVLLKRENVPYPVSLAAFFSERLSDMLAVVLLALLGLSLYPAARPVVVMAAGLVAIGLVLLSQERIASRLALLTSGTAMVGRFTQQLHAVLQQARHCHRPRVLLISTLLALVAWAAEAWAFFLVLEWMSVDVGLEYAVFVYAVSMLAGGLSLMPGGLGGAEAAMVALLLWHGASSADAVAATVIIRLATLWFAVFLGAVSLLGLQCGPGNGSKVE